VVLVKPNLSFRLIGLGDNGRVETNAQIVREDTMFMLDRFIVGPNIISGCVGTLDDLIKGIFPFRGHPSATGKVVAGADRNVTNWDWVGSRVLGEAVDGLEIEMSMSRPIPSSAFNRGPSLR